MRTLPPALCLFTVVPAVLLLAAGCAPLGERVVHRAGPVTITRVNFRGWKDSFRMTNGEVEVVVVPQIARIMKYSLAGGENLLWVNDELTPDRGGLQAPEHETPQWLNFGGHKLWIAPEKDWDWPPDWQLDRGPCRAILTAGGSLRLIGMASHRHGVRFDRRITLAPQGTRIEIEHIMRNTSDKSVSGAIWEVTQVKADCVGFVPLGPGAEYRTSKGGPLDEQWSRLHDMLLVKPSGTTGKVFISGPPGWLGCKRGDLIYLKAFHIADAPPPESEAPREVYTGDMGYTELEVVGPAVTLQPGTSAALKETWHLARVKPIADDEDLIAVIRETAADLLQR